MFFNFSMFYVLEIMGFERVSSLGACVNSVLKVGLEGLLAGGFTHQYLCIQTYHMHVLVHACGDMCTCKCMFYVCMSAYNYVHVCIPRWVLFYAGAVHGFMMKWMCVIFVTLIRLPDSIVVTEHCV